MNISETTFNQFAAFTKFSSDRLTEADHVAMQGNGGNLELR